MIDKLIYEDLGSIDNKKFKVSKTNEGFMRLHGVFGVCGVRNNNNRVYEKNNYKSMIVEMQQRIATGSVLGELEHPQTMNITLDRVSHKIDSISIDENGEITGTITLLNTPKGQIAQAIVESGAPLFISSRATGSVDSRGNVTLEHLQTYDLVGSPGFSQAKLTLCESLSDNQYGALNESSYWLQLPEGEDGSQLAKMPILEGINDYNKIENNMNLESKIAELENKIKELSERKSPEEYFKNVAAPIIESWADTEFRKDIENKINNKISNKIDERLDEIAPVIQKWVVEEFGGEITKYLAEVYSGEIDNYIKDVVSPEIEESIENKIKDFVLEKFTPAVDKYLKEEYASQITKWITEQYSPVIEGYIRECVIPEIKSSNKDSALAMLEALENTKPENNKINYSRKINENADEPKYIAEMPERFKAKWNLASQQVKEHIQFKAKVYKFSTPESIEQFWENVSWDEQTPKVNEDKKFINKHEQMIRESIAAWQNSKHF